ncbi:bifunctional folylpolyglutamate synthase/dihydrofolate synthase [Ornithinibacillus contaminans]|uniref:bifunctional folylpolyglutamate synthase/dihydrofolate synthase n=1 Tax=Ornithinibacillus contaminans TaxID=694055 RepID=UPI00064DED74|nr:folylpolyglutamate synthase/dihydrofolate synthase family protein [Ornithinibacillus contaminans]
MLQSIKQVEDYFKRRSNLGIKPGLERMNQLLASQHNPETKCKTIHIAGTNGKGSTLTFLKQALIANDLRVGVFTSPSLTGLTGHIWLNNEPISEEAFLALFNQLIPVITQLDENHMHPTEFEIITVIAFMYFRDTVDIALIEAGMGGREDTTNCIQPILSIITNIAMDHAYFLGDTLEKIAYQKAGIVKANVPTVVGNINPVCLPVIMQEAQEKDSIVYQLNEHYEAKDVRTTMDGQMFRWRFNERAMEIAIKMQGRHQVENASTAVMALTLMEMNGFQFSWERALAGIRTAQVIGRFERIHESPTIILDGAHNPHGMEAFVKTVVDVYDNSRKHLIFAGFRDKELEKMLALALPYFNSITVTSFDHPRAMDTEELNRLVSTEKLKESLDWRKTLAAILQHHDDMDCYFVAGSLHFIGEVRAFLKEYNT